MKVVTAENENYIRCQMFAAIFLRYAYIIIIIIVIYL